jgi:hypothetical protein
VAAIDNTAEVPVQLDIVVPGAMNCPKALPLAKPVQLPTVALVELLVVVIVVVTILA